MPTSAVKVDNTNMPIINNNDLESFAKCLRSSRRVIALVGAGLSAASGLSTFRGPGGLWRQYDAMSLATPEAFRSDAVLVWQFYAERKHRALKARPNRAHLALTEFARRNKDFLTLSQNVVGLCERAGHPHSQLQLLHGSLFKIKCMTCEYTEDENFEDYIPTPQMLKEKTPQSKAPPANLVLPDVPLSALPRCPNCPDILLRPGVVWFGEGLPADTLENVESWMDAGPVDLMLVIGTSSNVYPAAGYTEEARNRGARIAVVNMDREDAPPGRVDWVFQGNAVALVPEMLSDIIGKTTFV